MPYKDVEVRREKQAAQKREKYSSVGYTAQEKLNRADRNRRYRNSPEGKIKRKARKMVWTAISNGTLVRLPCQVCGNPDTQAHHADYSKPLEVTFLCNEHHEEADKESVLQ